MRVIITIGLLALLGSVLAEEIYEDTIIIGAGVSGLQFGYYMNTANRPYLILERSDKVANIFRRFPRHEKLISINKRATGRKNKEFQLRHDWNSLVSDDYKLRFPWYTDQYFAHRKYMVQYLEDYQRKLGIGPIRFNTDIKNLRPVYNESLGQNSFVMEDQHGNIFRTRTIIVATGLYKPVVPEVVGAEHFTGYEDVPIHPDNFTEERVLILGNGNAGFEVAATVIPKGRLVHMLSRSRMKFAFHTHYLGNTRALNLEFMDNYLLKSLGGALEIDIEKMHYIKRPDGRFDLVPGNPELRKVFEGIDYPLRYPYDRIVRCLGFEFDPSLFADDVPFSFDPKKKYPRINHSYESALVPGMFFAGTIVHSLDKHRGAGGFIAGIRYTTRILFNILEWRNHGQKWPSKGLEPMSSLIGKGFFRFSEISSMWHMPGFYADIILLRNGGKNIEFVEEFPINLLPEFERYTGHKVGPEGVVVQTVHFGRNYTGEHLDTMKLGRNRFQASTAYDAVLLHPTYYFYKTLPNQADFDTRNKDQIMPRALRMHLLADDPHQLWDEPHRYLLTTRRFYEGVFRQDIRHFYGEDCMVYAFTHKELPLGCQPNVLNQKPIIGGLRE